MRSNEISSAKNERLMTFKRYMYDFLGRNDIH